MASRSIRWSGGTSTGSTTASPASWTPKQPRRIRCPRRCRRSTRGVGNGKAFLAKDAKTAKESQNPTSALLILTFLCGLGVLCEVIVFYPERRPANEDEGIMKLTLDKAGRVVIPKSVRDDLG